MTKTLAIAALVLATVTFGAQTSFADSRQQEQADCMSDAFRLCGKFIPNEGKIAACMAQNKSKLSPACRRHFN